MDERVAIVSGAAGGLGGPIAQRLARDGWSVASCDLAPVDESALHGELDVTDVAAVRAFAARVEAELGPIGAVVTAAGVQCTGPSEAVGARRLGARARRQPDRHLERRPGLPPGDARARARDAS